MAGTPLQVWYPVCQILFYMPTMCQQAVNFLRYACVPVGVVEGRAPDEKLELLQQR